MHKESWEASTGETLSYKKNSTGNNFADDMQSAKSMKKFVREKFPLYSTLSILGLAQDYVQQDLPNQHPNAHILSV